MDAATQRHEEDMEYETRRLEEYLEWRRTLDRFERNVVDTLWPQEGYVEANRVFNDIRDAINLLVVYAEEYDFPEEAVVNMRDRLEKIAMDAATLTA